MRWRLSPAFEAPKMIEEQISWIRLKLEDKPRV